MKPGFILAVMLLLAVPAHADSEPALPVDFSLPALGGGEVSVADYLGQWVVINFWATWCVPCRKEIPDLSDLHDRRSDVTVLGLAFEDTDEASFARFLDEFKATYPILRVDVYDPPEPFGAPKVLPTTILLDTGGRPVKTFLGPVTSKDIEKFIDQDPDGSAGGS